MRAINSAGAGDNSTVWEYEAGLEGRKLHNGNVMFLSIWGKNEIMSKYRFSVRQVETTDIIHLYLSDVDVNTCYLRIKF